MKKINTILLVDDDQTSNFLTKNIIQHLKITDNIETSENGEEALAFIREKCLDVNGNMNERCPELILLDINMPVMDGFEFLENFQKLPNSLDKSIQVVLLTSSSHREDIAKSKQYNVSAYIDKPLTEDKLRRIVV